MRQYLSSTNRAHKKAVKYLKDTKEVPTHFAAAKGTTLTQKVVSSLPTSLRCATKYLFRRPTPILVKGKTRPRMTITRTIVMTTMVTLTMRMTTTTTPTPTVTMTMMTRMKMAMKKTSTGQPN